MIEQRQGEEGGWKGGGGGERGKGTLKKFFLGLLLVFENSDALFCLALHAQHVRLTGFSLGLGFRSVRSPDRV